MTPLYVFLDAAKMVLHVLADVIHKYRHCYKFTEMIFYTHRHSYIYIHIWYDLSFVHIVIPIDIMISYM